MDSAADSCFTVLLCLITPIPANAGMLFYCIMFDIGYRLRLLVDVSGSMYRFNGHDARLQREMEAVCMVMEAFQGYEHKLKVHLKLLSLTGS